MILAIALSPEGKCEKGIAGVSLWNAHRWHSHQVRHNAATELHKEFRLEMARIILGHHSAAVTETYAE